MHIQAIYQRSVVKTMHIPHHSKTMSKYAAATNRKQTQSLSPLVELTDVSLLNTQQEPIIKLPHLYLKYTKSLYPLLGVARQVPIELDATISQYRGRPSNSQFYWAKKMYGCYWIANRPTKLHMTATSTMTTDQCKVLNTKAMIGLIMTQNHDQSGKSIYFKQYYQTWLQSQRMQAYYAHQ